MREGLRSAPIRAGHLGVGGWVEPTGIRCPFHAGSFLELRHACWEARGRRNDPNSLFSRRRASSIRNFAASRSPAWNMERFEPTPAWWGPLPVPCVSREGRLRSTGSACLRKPRRRTGAHTPYAPRCCPWRHIRVAAGPSMSWLASPLNEAVWWSPRIVHDSSRSQAARV